MAVDWRVPRSPSGGELVHFQRSGSSGGRTEELEEVANVLANVIANGDKKV